MPKQKDAQIYYGCPNCIEPMTTLKEGQHIFINVTTTDYGLKSQVVINCTSCGFIQDITKEVKQISKTTMDELLNKKTC